MKNRILSFVLFVMMLFSCLSLEVFATATDMTSQANELTSPAIDMTSEKIAEYLKNSERLLR